MSITISHEDIIGPFLRKLKMGEALLYLCTVVCGLVCFLPEKSYRTHKIIKEKETYQSGRLHASCTIYFSILNANAFAGVQ